MVEKDEETIYKLIKPYLPLEGFDLSEFVSDGGVCLRSDDNIALFERDAPRLWTGHYFFKVRGKDALKLSRQMLKEFFSVFQPLVIKGLTPLEHLGARWMSRQLGFKSYGVVQTVVGPCELFILTKEDWENKINE